MITLDEFVGINAKSQATTWLNAFFHGNGAKGMSIFYGVSGNGKSLLVKLLSEAYDVELFSICPFDIKGEDSLNNFIKSINSKPLTKEKKIVLIDDIDDFSVKYRNRLLKISSVYPIIYTTKTLYDNVLPNDFKSKCEIIRIKKPLTSELIEHLKTKCSLPMEQIDEIARKSKSVRSAELSICNECINELIIPPQTKGQMITELKQRRLNQKVTRDNIHSIFKAVKGYDNKALKVMERLAEFDFRIKYKFESIDPFFVNNMIEPIDKVVEYQEYKKNNKKKPKREVERAERNNEPKKEKNKVISIDNWMK